MEKSKQHILNILKNHPEGLTIQKLSTLTKLSRITTTKYVERLLGEGRIYERKVGVYRLLFSKERLLETVKEEKIIKKLKEKLK
jgi:DNA-binding IclR family transcriptional regulator